MNKIILRFLDSDKRLTQINNRLSEWQEEYQIVGMFPLCLDREAPDVIAVELLAKTEQDSSEEWSEVMQALGSLYEVYASGRTDEFPAALTTLMGAYDLWLG